MESIDIRQIIGFVTGLFTVFFERKILLMGAGIILIVLIVLVILLSFRRGKRRKGERECANFAEELSRYRTLTFNTDTEARISNLESRAETIISMLDDMRRRLIWLETQINVILNREGIVTSRRYDEKNGASKYLEDAWYDPDPGAGTGRDRCTGRHAAIEGRRAGGVGRRIVEGSRRAGRSSRRAVIEAGGMDNGVNLYKQINDKKLVELYEQIYCEYDGGKSIAEIARQLGRDKGEIELILNLRKQKE